ncbi:unnamed protein product [Ostreobium quekettii]|uniref:Uncharacterized protein n=1 Tax=Ostreobium quekettii TaxID=121088 RepID=A0A8S1IK98_9CHLO|nr:unnamed protein product [Ostreobium quekettii]
MEELPGKRSEGGVSFSTQNDASDDGGDDRPRHGGIRASRRDYQRLASLWTDLWSAPASGSAGARQKRRSRAGGRRPAGSDMESRGVIWDATWESPAAHLGDAEICGEEANRGSSPFGDWQGAGRGVGMSTWPGSEPGVKLGARGGGPPCLWELPGIRSGDNESVPLSDGEEEKEEGGVGEGGEGQGKGLEGLKGLERCWEERWGGAWAADDDAGSTGEAATLRPGRSRSLVHRFMKALSISSRGRRAHSKAFEITDEFRDFTDRVMPPFPPDYIDPVASSFSI